MAERLLEGFWIRETCNRAVTQVGLGLELAQIHQQVSPGLPRADRLEIDEQAGTAQQPALDLDWLCIDGL